MVSGVSLPWQSRLWLSMVRLIFKRKARVRSGIEELFGLRFLRQSRGTLGSILLAAVTPDPIPQPRRFNELEGDDVTAALLTIIAASEDFFGKIPVQPLDTEGSPTPCSQVGVPVGCVVASLQLVRL